MGWARTPKRAPACGGWGFCRGYSGESSPEGAQGLRPGTERHQLQGWRPRELPLLCTPSKGSQRESSLQQTSRTLGWALPHIHPSRAHSRLLSLPHVHCPPRSPLHVHHPISVFLPLPFAPSSPSSPHLSPSSCLHFQRDESHLSSIRPHHLV